MSDKEYIKYIVNLMIEADERLDKTNIHDDEYGDILNSISLAKYELFYIRKDRVNAKSWQNEEIMDIIHQEIDRERFKRGN